MPSLRKIESARANGARSHGPVTAEGKQRSAQNAMRHGLLARCVVLENETREGFDALFELHLDRLQPADGVEFGFIEEMVSSYWRMRRAWAIETRLLQKRLDDQPGADEIDRLAGAFENLAASQSIGLIHRYETRLHCMYQRALKNLLLLRKAGMPNEPNPISEHSEDGPGEAPAGNPQPPAPPEMPNEPSPNSGHSGSGPDELPPPSPQPPAPPEMPNEPNPISEHSEGGPGAQPAPSPQPTAPVPAPMPESRPGSASEPVSLALTDGLRPPKDSWHRFRFAVASTGASARCKPGWPVGHLPSRYKT